MPLTMLEPAQFEKLFLNILTDPGLTGRIRKDPIKALKEHGIDLKGAVKPPILDAFMTTYKRRRPEGTVANACAGCAVCAVCVVCGAIDAEAGVLGVTGVAGI